MLNMLNNHKNMKIKISNFFPLYKEIPQKKYLKEIIVKGTGSNSCIFIQPKELDFSTINFFIFQQ